MALRAGLIALLAALAGASPLVASHSNGSSLSSCPGYKASNVATTGSGLTADLRLAGHACNTYGKDLQDLRLEVEYQTDKRLHVLIYDSEEQVYQVPESVLSRPSGSSSSYGNPSELVFTYTENPFSFAVSRRNNNEVLFNTSGSPLIFQSQYLNVRTSLPSNPSLYGLGEHSDSFRLNTTNSTRTIWNRDAYGIPHGGNLYGDHPIYFDHRGALGTHGVFLLNSNGMDIKINSSAQGEYLEYNSLGGVFDFYFLAGSSPKEVSSQYAEVVGLPAMQAYWTLGFHQCRYGYQDVFNVAEVVYNYSKAEIPLETMWTDIDYMDHRKVFTSDPERFPLNKMRELVSYLHDHDQHYIVMVDPAVAYQDYPAFNNGRDQGIFLKSANGSIYEGAVWPGPTAFPDWFDENTQAYWNSEFQSLFGPDNFDLDGLWIDMNEAANFCPYPCLDPVGYAKTNNLPPTPPPVRANPRPLPGFPMDFQPEDSSSSTSSKRTAMPKVASPRRRQESDNGTKLGLPGRDVLDPSYAIANTGGVLSMNTLDVDLVHANGLIEYDVHNLYGTMMSSASREALLSIKPQYRPLVITRSTFAGAGAKVGHWLGDNFSIWDHYRISIAGILNFASIFQVPMVGADVCGFGQNTTETLCARWAMLGAFYPFYRNHNELSSISQEFYVWPTVAEAAKNAIATRYKMLDYFYTALHRQTTTGEPAINPLFYLYPEDENTFPIDLQFFFGDAVLVSPVTEEDATSVEIYLPKDIFYDYYTGKAVQGQGEKITLNNVNFTTIPLHIRGGTIIPLRNESAATTAALRRNDFNLLIAPGSDGTAKGTLYLDEGRLIEQPSTTMVNFHYSADGTFTMDGQLGYNSGVAIRGIILLGQGGKPSNVTTHTEASADVSFDSDNEVLTVAANALLTQPLKLQLK